MALSSLMLRRALALSASVLKHRPILTAALPAPPPPPPAAPLPKAGTLLSPAHLGSPARFRPHCAIQCASFLSSPSSSDRFRSGDGDDRKIDPDEILFEGCDYNHWLITMDFPKDPKPTSQEMVETYVQTLAKVVGSVEEAKKRMYACSTTTYNGFQAVMTEEMSEKFRGLPGVVFILPDSYIDPINKEYGGDKYDNGVITPRPPPVQYGRQGRYGDRNRNYDRPRYDRQRDGMPMQQRNPSFDRQGPPQGGGNFAPQQNYEQDRQGYGPPGGGNFAPERRDYGQGERRDYAQAGGGNFAPQQNYGQDRQGYGPPGGGNFAPERRDYEQGERRDYAQAGGRENFPGGRDGYQGRDTAPAYQRDANLGQDGNFASQGRRDFSQGQQGNFPPQEPRNFPQGQQVSGGSAYGQNYTGARQNYGQNFPEPSEGQSAPHTDRPDGIHGEQGSFTSYPQTGTSQGHY